jgi:hypothetical protein
MALETGFGTFEMEPATRGQFMTLVAFPFGYRRMLMERRKTGGRLGSAIEPDFLRPHCRDQYEFVFAGRRRHFCVEHVRKRLVGLNGLAVEFQSAAGCSRDDIDLPGGERGFVRRSQNLPFGP